MLNNIKIGAKLIGGFGIVITALVIIGAVSLINMMSIRTTVNDLAKVHMFLTEKVNAIDAAATGQNLASSNFGLHKDKGFIATYGELSKEVDKAFEEAKNLIKTDEELVKDGWVGIVENLEKQHDIFAAACEKFMDEISAGAAKEKWDPLADEVDTRYDELMSGIDSFLKKNSEESNRVAEEATKSVASAIGIITIIGIIAIIFALFVAIFLSRSISIPVSKVAGMLKEMAKGLINEKLSMDRGDEIGILAKSADTLVDTLKDLIVDDGGVVLDSAANKDLTKRLKKEYQGAFLKMKENINKVIESLDTAMTQVSQSTEQVSSASQQIASGSQSLAQGANEQASSLEEVSSSLEEMSSMTKQNAENANQAKKLAGEANGNAATGSDALGKMSSSINKIKESSDQTAKIVKTIDEIAMQTNLLALNAAVEAARAGEAGRGFAVVAEEVRNLAQRSAQAAKNTADMISESVKNAEEGVKISTDVTKTFEAIVTSVKKVNDLINEIAAASQEQSQGIDQVNTAVAQMDKVTQQNAANSEESASAAEELSSQAEELQSMVAQFVLSTGGSGGAKQHTVHSVLHHAPAAAAVQQKTAHRLELSKASHAQKTAFKKDGNGKKDPEDVIPMNEETLKSF
jgi:methyl-accepting chemotaxis protein